MTRKKDQLRKEFVESVSHLLELNKFEGTAFFKFLRHYSKRFQNPHIDLDEVLVEGVRRGVEWIGKHNKPIDTPEAWLRGTCLNILRDEVKSIVREEEKSEELSLVSLLKNSPLPRAELIEQLEYLDMAMKKLSEDERRLITLRFFERKTYEQIKHYYLRLDGVEVSVPALRKRESRALKRLRKYFFCLYDGLLSHSN